MPLYSGQVCVNSSQPIGAYFCVLLGKIATLAYRLTQSIDSVSQALHSCIPTFRLTHLGFKSCKNLLISRDVRAEHFEHASIRATLSLPPSSRLLKISVTEVVGMCNRRTQDEAQSVNGDV